MTRKAGILVLSVAFCSALVLGQGPQKRRKHHSSSASNYSETFKPDCSNPSYPSPEATPIDEMCGLAGIGPEGSQNEAKNNFCASGEPQSINIDGFTTLQEQAASTAGVTFGEESPTVDRAPLQTLGEGKLVVFRGYVLNARQEGAESVNCGKPPRIPNRPSNHDIHISLGDSPDATECSGIVAEMIPHHRPATWTAANVLKVKEASLKVRVTGQLMFDSSHVPCNGNTPVGSNPKRVSLWEVHPIYKFEVCTADCEGGGQWVSLEEWLQSH